MFLSCMIFRLLMFDTKSEHAELGHALMAQVVFSSMCNPEYENYKYRYKEDMPRCDECVIYE